MLQVKEEFDHTTILFETGAINDEWKKKRRAIQSRVSRLMIRLETAMFGPTIKVTTSTEPVRVRRSSSSVEVVTELTTTVGDTAVDDTVGDTTVVDTAVVDTSREEESDEEESDEEESDDDEEQIEKTGMLYLEFKPDAKFLVVGDSAKYEELCELGFTSVDFKMDIEGVNLANDYEFMFCGHVRY